MRKTSTLDLPVAKSSSQTRMKLRSIIIRVAIILPPLSQCLHQINVHLVHLFWDFVEPLIVYSYQLSLSVSRFPSLPMYHRLSFDNAWNDSVCHGHEVQPSDFVSSGSMCIMNSDVRWIIMLSKQ